MKLSELLDVTWELADDARAKHLWKPGPLTIYANEAHREAAARSRLITDSLTDSYNSVPVCLFTVAANDRYITLHPKTIFVHRVKLASQDIPLPKCDRRDLDIIHPGWEAADPGNVLVYVSNWQSKRLLFHNRFAVDDSVRLTITRLPLALMFAADDVPEIDEHHHMGLVNWMLFRAFSKPDAETLDKTKAQDHLALFERQFGAPLDAVNEQWMREHHGYDQFEGQR